MAALAGVFAVMGGFGIFLVSQGLIRASLWATIAGLPVTLVGGIAGVWSAVVASRALRKTGQRDEIEASRAASRSGDIRQEGSGGITIAHSGKGNIVVQSETAAGLAPRTSTSGVGPIKALRYLSQSKLRSLERSPQLPSSTLRDRLEAVLEELRETGQLTPVLQFRFVT